jgi:hypothetical protein
MRYRDAKLLDAGDQVILKKDNTILIVNSIEIYGQFKTVKINVLDINGSLISLFNDQII